MEEKTAKGARAAIVNDSGDITVMQKEQWSISLLQTLQYSINIKSVRGPRDLLYSIKWALLTDGELPSICRLEALNPLILLTGSSDVLSRPDTSVPPRNPLLTNQHLLYGVNYYVV
jgi:hypothetical protein